MWIWLAENLLVAPLLFLGVHAYCRIFRPRPTAIHASRRCGSPIAERA